MNAPELAGWRAPLRPTRLDFGSEFCEHLLPSARALREALHRAEDAGRCGRGLAAPMMRALFARLGIERLEIDVPLFADDAAVRRFAQALRPSEALCATGHMCYCPEVLRAGAC